MNKKMFNCVIINCGIAVVICVLTFRNNLSCNNRHIFNIILFIIKLHP